MPGLGLTKLELFTLAAEMVFFTAFCLSSDIFEIFWKKNLTTSFKDQAQT